MAVFASTTIPYSAPNAAMTIKALEKRQADMQAQMAQGAITPENTQTPIQGVGHLANIIGDRFNMAQTEAKAAAGKQELSRLIAGYNPDSPDAFKTIGQIQIHNPELGDKLLQHYHDNKQNVRTEGGLNTRSEATIAAENERNAANIAGRKDVVQTQEAGATGRTGMTIASEEERQRQKLASDEARQGSQQSHEANQLRLKSELDAAQKERDYAQQNNLADRASAAQEKITRLTSELSSAETRQQEAFKESQFARTLSQDAKMKDLDRAAVAANLERQIAANSGDKAAQRAADEKLQALKTEADDRRAFIKHTFDLEQSKQKEAADLKLQERDLQSKEKLAAEEAKAKAEALKSDPKRNEAIRASENDYRKGLSHIENLEEAATHLDKGIYTGVMQNVAPTASGVPGASMFVDKEKAQRTSRYNTIVGEDAIRDMATTLKGSSTNFEMNEFKRMKNDPNISDEMRANQLRKVVKAARADLESQARETKAIGGDTERVDAAMRGGAAPAAGAAARPEGRDDASLIAEAKDMIAKGKDPAAIKKRLEAWGVKGGL